MPEVIIKYKTPRTLKALHDFAKYFDYVVVPVESDSIAEINGVTLVKGNLSIDDRASSKIFSGKNINPKNLRDRTWKR